MRPERGDVVRRLQTLAPYSYPEEREVMADEFLGGWDDAAAWEAYLDAWANEPRWRAFHAVWLRDGGRKA